MSTTANQSMSVATVPSASRALASRAGVPDLPAPGDWRVMQEMASELVKSGLLPAHVKTPAAALAIIQRGRELGVPPMYALNNIVVIGGKTVTNAELMLALIYRDHGDGAVIFEETTAERCVVAYRRAGWPGARRYAFTIEDAKRADLLKNDNWRKYPAAMLRARAISAVARMAFPDSIGGMYGPDELGVPVIVDAEGQVQPDLDALAAQQEATPARPEKSATNPARRAEILELAERLGLPEHEVRRVVWSRYQATLDTLSDEQAADAIERLTARLVAQEAEPDPREVEA